MPGRGHPRRAPARNRQLFLDQVQDTLGLTVEVLAPEEEARLSLAGVLSALDAADADGARLLVFDVGGGSSEFALVRPGREPVFASLPLGVLTLSQARPLGDPPEPEKVAALKEELSARLGSFYQGAIEPYSGGELLPGGHRRGGDDAGGPAIKVAGLRLE